MACEYAFIAGWPDEVRELGGKKTLQSSDALDLGNLFGHAQFEAAIPFGKIIRLRLHTIVEFLQAENRPHSGDQRRMIDRLGKILVGAGIKAGNHVLRIGSGSQNDDRRERAIAAALEAATNLDAVELRHRDVQ